MGAIRHGLIALPLIAYALTAWTVRPRREYAAPRRLAVIRAAVIAGAFAVLSVEVLSAFEALTAAAILWTWVVAVLVAGAGALIRWLVDRRDGERAPLTAWPVLPRLDRLLLAVIIALLGAEFVLALASAPNTYDAQTYHLPKIEHWVAQENVQLHATRIHRQVTFPPGAEYILVHVRLLTGGDALYGLLQWAAGLGCLVAVTRLVAQLGGSRRVQLLAATVVASAPMLVLQASSTQTDLVVAGWVAALVTIALDGAGREPAVHPGPGTVVLLGLSVGLIAVTKTTGLAAAAPFLVWWALAWLRRGLGERPVRTIAAVGGSTVVVLVLGALLIAPYTMRLTEHFGHPLGPDYSRNAVAMQRHDPLAVLVNALRQGQTGFDLPVAGEWAGAGVAAFARLVGVDPNDPEITFGGARYPSVAWYPLEDKAAYPIAAFFVLIGTIAALVRRSSTEFAGRRRAYAIATVSAALIYVGMIKWQPWGNRLMLFLLVVAAPLAGFFVDAALRKRPTRPWLARATAALLAIGVLAGSLSVLYGWPRRLVGSESALLLSDWETRFVVRPDWADHYVAVADAVKGAGARRVGLVQSSDTWEYPWWVVFDGQPLLPMQSMAPTIPSTSPADVDAIICNAHEHVCRPYIPPSWNLVMAHPFIGYALPGPGT